MLNKAELLTAFPDGLWVQNGPSRVWLGVAALEAVQAELHERAGHGPTLAHIWEAADYEDDIDRIIFLGERPEGPDTVEEKDM